MQRTRLHVLVGLLALLAAESMSAEGVTAASHTAETESEIFTMDQIYPSMFGPKDTDSVTLLKTDEPEVLWITGIKANMVGADGETPQSPEYLCHSVFSRASDQPAAFVRRLGLSVLNPKMFTLVQGLNEIRFPEGFGMPVLSSDRFGSTVMLMNPTEPEEPVHVGVDSRIEYVRESELDQKMKPLFMVPLVATVPVEGENADHTHHHHGDLGDDSCLDVNAHSTAAMPVEQRTHGGSSVTKSDSGLEMTGHWYVPPGRHVYRHRLGPLDELIRFDTRVHFIATHLHPFGESLELIDLTTGESVFKATAANYSDRVAVKEINYYSSQEGLPINRHHEHEMVTVYNNTLSHDVDSMATMYLYLHDSFRTRSAERGGT